MWVSKKQLKANKINSKKWWVKTIQWKAVAKNNAVKHWLSSCYYDESLENSLVSEYWINWTLEKMLIKNICISKTRYENWVLLEHKLINHILNPERIKKVYESQEEHERFIKATQEFDNMINLWPDEPDYEYEYQKGEEFEYDLKKIQYLVDCIWKYNYQNETRLNKNIVSLLSLVKK